MKGRDMLAELVHAVHGLGGRQRRWLAGLGIDAAVQYRAGLIGAAAVVVEGRWFRFALAGEAGGGGAVIQGVYDRPLALAGGDGDVRAVLDGIADLVAWDPRAPGRFWTRAGQADWLGEGAVAAARAGGVLRLHPTPLSWLRAGCPDDGAVALAPFQSLAAGAMPPGPDDGYLRDALGGAAEIVCPQGDEDFAADVHRALRRRAKPAGLPRVMLDDASGAPPLDAEAA